MFADRTGDKPISLRWADMILRSAVEKAGLAAKGISTHSTLRSFITKLHRNGTDLYTIKKITGHKDFKALERYVEIDSQKRQGSREQGAGGGGEALDVPWYSAPAKRTKKDGASYPCSASLHFVGVGLAQELL
jgi:hypothetical protein